MQLPEKMIEVKGYNDGNRRKINQILDYLAEKEKAESEASAQGWNEGHQSLKEITNNTPSLAGTTSVPNLPIEVTYAASPDRPLNQERE